jgi:hypothetical protein
MKRKRVEMTESKLPSFFDGLCYFLTVFLLTAPYRENAFQEDLTEKLTDEIVNNSVPTRLQPVWI